MKVKGDVDMTGFDAFGKGGYKVKYYKYGGYYPGHYVWIGYATKAEALKGIKEFNGRFVKVEEYPGKCKPGKEIKLADLEAPENE